MNEFTANFFDIFRFCSLRSTWVCKFFLRMICRFGNETGAARNFFFLTVFSNFILFYIIYYILYIIYIYIFFG